MFSVFTDDMEHCIITGSPEVHIHHIFNKHSKALSEKYGFMLPLRPDWHNMSDHGIHFDREMDFYWRRRCQEYYEIHYGSKEDFIKEFNSNYL